MTREADRSSRNCEPVPSPAARRREGTSPLPTCARRGLRKESPGGARGRGHGGNPGRDRDGAYRFGAALPNRECPRLDRPDPAPAGQHRRPSRRCRNSRAHAPLCRRARLGFLQRLRKCSAAPASLRESQEGRAAVPQSSAPRLAFLLWPRPGNGKRARGHAGAESRQFLGSAPGEADAVDSSRPSRFRLAVRSRGSSHPERQETATTLEAPAGPQEHERREPVT